MEIRTLSPHERPAVAELLDSWRLAGGASAGDRFRRQLEIDPRYADENVWIAVERGDLVGTLTILPRQLRVLGHTIPTGGIGNLMTAEDARGRGVASQLLDRACEAMRARGLELAMLFPGSAPATTDFFTRRGFSVWAGQRTILRRDASGARPGQESSGEVELHTVGTDDDRVLQSVRSIHAAYTASRSGTVVRDEALWRSTLAPRAEAPEEFWIARRGGLTVAYARAALVDDVLTLIEFGRFEDGSDALARLIASLLMPRDADPLARGGVPSADLRSFLVLPAFDDIGLMVALEQQGIRSHPMNDTSASFRCVNLIGLAARLDVDLLPGEEGTAFLSRILPPDGLVFWPADRF